MNLIFLTIITISILCKNVNSQLSANQTVEQNLVNTLFTGYSRNIRPIDSVSVGVGVSLKQIISLDEKNQIMTTSCYISQLWYDGRLSWTPSSYNNIQVIMVPLKNIWAPDTIVLNSADGDGYFKINSDFSLVQVNNDGSVYYLSQLIGLKTRCSLNVQNYPFDKQSCGIRITSWSNDDSRISYSVNDSYVDLSDFTNHTIWNLIGTSVISKSSSDRVVFADSSNTEIVFQLSLQRKALYYMMNTVFPCFILNVVTLLVFYMPVGNQMGLSNTAFLTFSVYSLRIASDIPVQSDYLPKISSYFISSITFILIGMLWHVSRNRMVTQARIPKHLDTFCGCLHKKVFFFCFPNDKNKTAPATNDKKKEQEETLKVEVIGAENKTKIENNNGLELVVTEPEKLEITKDKANESKKCKCNNCDRCADCEADFKKEKDKGKNKKDVEAKLEALNYLVFIIMFIVILVTNIGIWTSFSN